MTLAQIKKIAAELSLLISQVKTCLTLSEGSGPSVKTGCKLAKKYTSRQVSFPDKAFNCQNDNYF